MLRDYLKLHFIVLVWGFTGILGAVIKIPALDLVIFRTFIAASAIGVILLWTGGSFRQNRSTILKLFAIGALVGLHWILFFAAVKVGGASIGMIGLSTATLWTALLSPVFQRSSISILEIVLGAVVVAALIYIFQVEQAHRLGLCLSVAAGFAAALFSNLNGQMTKQHHHYVIAFYEITGACVACIAALPFAAMFMGHREHFIEWPGFQDVVYLLILGLICTVYPYTASVELLRRISVFAANLSINLEPVYGIVLAALLLGEHHLLNQHFYFGAAAIVAAVFAYPLIKYMKSNANRKRPEAVAAAKVQIER